ncbi:hypothetical protein JQX13_24885 [Archangium violaceum]|uniref:hypothetical protein n=1 Tax=Archangium violaceum TaxID=83451 RepID=UPI00193C2F61|nr:hypothetical protein [Archangium violaceum]QRK12983.1 hypothetical protein JQX13_24885 [Archangium violaceum]
MLKIDSTQIRAFQAAADHGFQENLLSLLRARHEHTLGGLPDDTLRMMIDKGIIRARSMGLTWQSSIAAFVALMFEIAPNFDEHPVIHRFLSMPDIPPDERIGLLADRIPDAVWTEAGRAYDVSIWGLTSSQAEALLEEREWESSAASLNLTQAS